MEHQQWNLKINEEEDLQEEWILVNFGSEKVWNRLMRLGKMSPHKNRESHYECGLHNSIHQSPVGPQKWLFLYQSTKFKSHKHTVAWIFHTGLRIHSITWPFQLLVAATASNNEGYIKIHNVWVGAWDQVPHKEQEKKKERTWLYIFSWCHMRVFEGYICIRQKLQIHECFCRNRWISSMPCVWGSGKI